MTLVLASAGSCPSCGGKLRPGAKFCSSCGASTAVDAAPPAPSRAEPAAEPRAGTWEYVQPIVALYLAYFGTSLLLGVSLRLGAPSSLTHWFLALNVLVTIGVSVAFFGDLRPLLAPRLPTLGALARFMGASFAFVLAFAGVLGALSALGVRFVSTSDSSGASLGVVLVVTSLVPAVCEELAFRGLIQTRLQKVLTHNEALFVQAGLFAALHLLPITFVTHFGMGLMFGWLRSRWSSIYPGMLLHAVWNALVVCDELFGLAEMVGCSCC